MLKNYLTRKKIRHLPFLTCLLWLLCFNNLDAQNITLTWDKESGCQTYKPQEKKYNEDIGQGACVRECETSVVKYTLTNSNSAWPAVWTVTGGTINTSNNTSCTVTWGNAGWGFVSVTVTTPNGPRTEQMCIEIIDGPKSEFIIYPGSDDSYIACVDEVLYFTNLSSPDGGSQIVSYFWDFGDGTYSSEFEPEHDYFNTGPNTYTVTLTVTNECNCSKKFKHDIKVVPTKSFPITCNSVVCENGSDTYSIPADIAAQCSDFKWIVDGGTITSPQPYGPSIDVTWDNVGASGFGYVTFDGSACGLDCSLVTIKVPVVLTSGTILGDTVVCAGQQYRYSLPQWPTTDFTWSIVSNGTGASILDTDQRNEIIVNTGNQGDIVLRCKYQNTMLKCGGYAEITIHVKAMGVITGPKEICQNSSGTYTLNNSYVGTWTIKRPNNTTATFTGNSYTFPFTIPGNYTLTVTGNDFCPPSNPFVIRVDAIPAAPLVTDIVGPALVCPNSPVEYSMVNTVAGTVLKWQVTGGTISGSNYGESVTVQFTGAGPYTIQVARENAATPHCSSAYTSKTIQAHTVTGTITGPQTNICASSVTNYSVSYGQGEVYNWTVTPASAGSVVTNGSSSVAIQWNQFTTNATITANVRKCNIWYPISLNVNLITGPTISVGTPSSICPNVTFTPTMTSSPALTGGTVTWNFGDGTIITTAYNAPPPSHYYANTGSATTYNVSVSVANPNGCLAPAVQNSTITVNPAPVALITPSTNFIYCGTFTPVTLTATIQSGSAGTQTIQWYNTSGPITSATSWSYTVTAYGEYKAWVQNSNGCGQFTNVVKFIQNCGPACTIVPNPTVTMTAAQGSCNTINATATTSYAPVSYSWSVGPEATPISTGPTSGSWSYDKAGNHTIIYNATYNGTSGLCTITKVQSVIIPFIPKIKYNVSCGSTPGMYTVTLLDNSNYYPPATPTTLEYLVDGTPYAVAVGTPSYTINVAPGSHTFGIRIAKTGYSTCTDVSAAVVLPAFPVSAISAPSTTCDGNGVALSPSAGVIAGSYYLWNFGDGTTNISPQPSKVFATPGTKTISLTVTNNQGCSTTSSINVTVAANQLAGNLTSTSPNCEDDPIIITYNNSGTAPTQYTWMKDTTVLATTSTNTYAVNESGSYWVTVTNALGCIKKLDAVPATFIMTPDPVIQGPSGVCVNEMFTLSGYAGQGTLEYRWLKDNVQVQTWGTSPILNYTMTTAGASTFKVEVRVSDGAGGYCISSASYPVTAYAAPAIPSLSFSFVSCDPYTFKLTANGGAPGTYVWSNGMSGQSINVNTGGPYKVTFTNAGGCTSTNQFDVPKNPEVYLWIFPSGCYEFCFKKGDQDGPFDILGPSPYAQFAKWFWYKDGSVDQQGAGTVPNYTINSSGVYNLGLDNGYCYKESDDMNVKVTDCKCEVKAEIIRVVIDTKPFCHYVTYMFIDNPYPVPIVVNVNANSGTGVFQPGAVTVPPGGANFQISFIPINFSGGSLEITFTSTYKDQFCRTIKTIDFPVCTASRNAEEDDLTTGMFKTNSLVVAPNPTKEATGLTYTFANEKAQVRTIEIYSLMGVLLEQYTPESQTGTWNVNLGKYAAGQYIVVMKEDGTALAQKAIIKE